jgi:hypothetical protein
MFVFFVPDLCFSSETELFRPKNMFNLYHFEFFLDPKAQYCFQAQNSSLSWNVSETIVLLFTIWMIAVRFIAHHHPVGKSLWNSSRAETLTTIAHISFL